MFPSTSIHNRSTVRTSQNGRDERDGEAFVRRYTRRMWVRNWCTMLRYNVSACVSDTREGVRRSPRTARTGPYPRMDPKRDILAEGPLPRRPIGNTVGTFNTPVVVNTLAVSTAITPESGQEDGRLDYSRVTGWAPWTG